MAETTLSYISLTIVLLGVPALIWGLNLALRRKRVTLRGCLITIITTLALAWVTYVILLTLTPGLMP